MRYERTAFLQALAEIPPRHRAWLESDDIELFAYYGFGILANDAQLELFHDVQRWPPGTLHLERWANRTGKTTGDLLLELWAAWKKWRYRSADLDTWLGFNYRVLHAAPLGNLAAKAHGLAEQVFAGTALQQRDPFTLRQRPALLAPFFTATKQTDSWGDERPIVRCLNGSMIEFWSTQGGAARLESEAWWLIVWDEFARQAPFEDIGLLLDQTFLPRAVDFEAPIVLTSTATKDSEAAYMELADRAEQNPKDWNLRTFDRSVNFAIRAEATERQVRLSLDKQAVERSVGGLFGGGSGELFPEFVLDNAFDDSLPDRTPPLTDELRLTGRWAEYSSFDHAMAGDPSVIMSWRMPWPPFTVDPSLPIIGTHLRSVRGSRTLTPNELQAMLRGEVETYRPEQVVVDGTAEGGLMVYRQARSDGLPVISCNFTERHVKYVTNKEWGLQALQRLLGWGLPYEVNDESGWIEEWPMPSGPFGILRFPSAWTRLKQQLRRYERDDEKLRQDEVMAAVMLAWWLIRMLEQAKPAKPQPFNVVATR